MIYISAAEAKELLSVTDVLEAVEEVFKLHARDEVVWPEPEMFRMSGREVNTKLHVKACLLESVPVMGVRVVGYRIFPDGSGSSRLDNTRYVLLSDPTTGKPLAIIDEHWNYPLRASVSAVVGAKYLNRSGASAVGMVGAGRLARTGLEALDEVMDLDDVVITDKFPKYARAFAEEMGDRLGIDIRVVDSIEKTCRGRDLVYVVTTAYEPIIMDSWIEPGTLVCTLGRDELERSLYQTADKVVLDSWSAATTFPDVREIVAEGYLSEDRLYAELQDIIGGGKPGRERDDERIVLRTTGLVSQDVALAYLTYQKAIESGIGLELEQGDL